MPLCSDIIRQKCSERNWNRVTRERRKDLNHSIHNFLWTLILVSFAAQLKMESYEKSGRLVFLCCVNNLARLFSSSKVSQFKFASNSRLKMPTPQSFLSSIDSRAIKLTFLHNYINLTFRAASSGFGKCGDAPEARWSLGNCYWVAKIPRRANGLVSNADRWFTCLASRASAESFPNAHPQQLYKHDSDAASKIHQLRKLKNSTLNETFPISFFEAEAGRFIISCKLI